MMSYANQDFAYESDYSHESEELGEEGQDRKKNYARGRSFKEARRKSRRKSTDTSCGIGARRNKRFSW